ncbi:hypothetical protein CDV55_107887 [Aspergillus turcosus]|uniref:Lipoyl-binding domain-containing protein n=1 Tax=Aspergillus turcosus TaxID=1245748 RepID=A0A229YDX9_9EURO|nr:hypothetical protein CDV55_107887 [Aspergillus turcosus]RLL93519.1 hypothetical protein CFD26_102743 [Aspergillus turcosus]
MTGQTIPCFDLLGVKPDFLPTQPGLFRDFDQINFYRVDKEEFERDMALFRSSRYKFQYEEVVFDMSAHNLLLEQARVEVAAFKARQAAAHAEMQMLEKESMDRWMAEKAQNKLPADEISIMRQDPDILTLHAPLDANVWKVNVADDDVISSTQVVAILEAMKMEISVYFNGDNRDGMERQLKIAKVLVQPGDTVKAGDALMFLRDI